MGTPSGHCGDQFRQFFISEIIIVRQTAVVTDERFVEPVRLEMPKLGRDAFLRTMPAVVEERDILRSGLAQASKVVNHRLARRLAILQDPEVKLSTAGQARLKQLLDGRDVVDATA